MTKYRQIVLRKKNVLEAIFRQEKNNFFFNIFFWTLWLSSDNMES